MAKWTNHVQQPFDQQAIRARQAEERRVRDAARMRLVIREFVIKYGASAFDTIATNTKAEFDIPAQ